MPVQGPGLRSTSPTPGTSSAASGSSPSWSRGSSARRCSASSARRAAASPRSCAPGCCPRSPAACCPGSDDVAAGAASGPASTRCASCAARASTRLARERGRAGGRPVRGDVHRVPRRGRARRVHRRARARGRATARRRSSCSPCAPTSTGAAPPTRRCRGCSAPTTCSSARCARDELRRAIERPARRAGLDVEPELVERSLADVEDEPGRPAAAVHRAARAVAAARRASPPPRDVRAHAAACAARWRGWPRRRTAGSTPAQQAVARTLLLRLADEGAGGTVVRRRVALAELDGASDADVAARARGCSPSAAC